MGQCCKHAGADGPHSRLLEEFEVADLDRQLAELIL